MMEIPGYHIQRELGQGGMARVYLAIQQALEREVAIKVLSPDLISDPEFCQRFLKEGKILAQLAHRNVVPIFDCGEHQGIYYMCMEFVPGGTLEDRLNQGGLPLIEATDILKQVASALEWSHGKKLIHRDVKPANVLFRDNGDPVLSDFGIAKTTRPDATKMTAVGMAIGTPTYMSPEQALAQDVTPKSDQYSLGVLFFEMLTGQVPYHADTAIQVAVQHMQAPIPSLPNELKHLQPVINRVMAKDPEERFNTMEELIVSLDKATADPSSDLKTEIIGSHANVGVAASKATVRNPILLVSVGIVSAGLLLGVLYLWEGKTGSKESDQISNVSETITPPALLDPATMQEVNKWLDIAKTHHSIGRLVEPPQNNALEAYWKVLELDATNRDAIQGLRDIAESFDVMARESLKGGDIDESKHLVTQGLMADPENNGLFQLQKQLNSR